MSLRSDVGVLPLFCCVGAVVLWENELDFFMQPNCVISAAYTSIGGNAATGQMILQVNFEKPLVL